MDADYRGGELRGSDVARAYAVVRHLFPSVDLIEWQAATSTEELRKRWLTVIDPAGVVRGLCLVIVSSRNDTRKQLEVPVFASVSLLDERGVAGRLLEYANCRAEEEGCDRIHVWPVCKRDHAVLSATSNLKAPLDGLTYDLAAFRRPSPH
jgi:hypothetical protein